AQRNLEVLREFAGRPPQGKLRRLHLRFLVSPVEIRGAGRVEAVVIERNRIDERERAVGTGEYETLDAQLVLRSVGYKGLPLPDVPFDARAHVVPNSAGRVQRDGEVVPGEYVTGWIKRGPTPPDPDGSLAETQRRRGDREVTPILRHPVTPTLRYVRSLRLCERSVRRSGR